MAGKKREAATGGKKRAPAGTPARRSGPGTARRDEAGFFRALTENAQEGILVLNSDGTVRYESPFAERTLGRKPGDRIGTSLFDRIHPDDAAAVADTFARLVENPGSSEKLDLRLRHEDGSWRLVEGTASSLVHNRAIEGVVVNFRDVTERTQAEETLRAGHDYFRTLMEHSLDSVTILNADGTLRWESPSTSRMLGYEPGSTLGRTSFDLIHPDDVSEVTDAFARLAQEPGGMDQREFRIRHKDGSWHTLDVVARNLLDDPIVNGIVVNQRDITERRKSEEALRESEEKFRSLAENSPNMIFIYKGSRVVYANRECERLMGYTRKEFYSSDFDFAALIAPECRHVVRAALASHMKGEEVPPYEYALITKGGERIEAILTTALMRFEGEVAILGAATDVTERKKAEQDRERMQEQHHLTARLATVGQLAAGVAHELNNPLAAVQGFAQLLNDRKDLEESIRNDVECIFNEAKRATKITANLLSFARKHQPEKRFVSINEVIEKSLELHAYRLRVNNIEVETELASDLPVTMADFHQLQQVFVNITTNAEQAMTEAHGKGKLTVKSMLAGDTIWVTLADDGPGIPPEILDRVFEPFYTTKEAGKGTGLGLDICRGIVEGHGGSLRVISQVGEGTVFVIEIPVVSEAGAAEQAGSMPAS